MAIKIGNLDINAFKLGSGDTTIYLGDTLLYPTTPPTPPFEGKWKATYQDEHVESAECDSSSEIIRDGEINLSNLVSVEVGQCVTSIGDWAFTNCSGLTSVTIGSGVTSIGEWAFNNCTSLASITIPNSVTSIMDNAFGSCSSLTSIDIPSGVTIIGNYVFEGCTSITSMIVNSNNTFYDSRNNCNGIINTSTNTLIAGCKNTVIPNSVTSIGDWVFTDCSGLTSITIPDSVTSIGSNAFRYCSGLTSATIGSSVTSIGEWAFYECNNLTSITINATTPPTLGYEAFNNTNDCPIYVVDASLTAYKTASGWSEYTSRIKPLSEKPQ